MLQYLQWYRLCDTQYSDMTVAGQAQYTLHYVITLSNLLSRLPSIASPHLIISPTPTSEYDWFYIKTVKRVTVLLRSNRNIEPLPRPVFAMTEINPHDPDIQIIEDVELMEEINTLTELGTTLIQAILEKEPMVNIRDLIDAGAPLWFQDNEGTSPLHAAAYVGNDQLVKILLEEGALWNAGESFLFLLSNPLIDCALVDNLGNTAGDIALSMNNNACYTLIRDAGIRAGASCTAAFPLPSLKL